MKILSTRILSTRTYNKISPSFMGKEKQEQNENTLPIQGPGSKNSDFREFKTAGFALESPPLIEINLKDRTEQLYISSSTTAKYLRSDGRKTDNALVDKFKEIYTQNLQDRMNSEDEARRMYAQTILENLKSRKVPGADTEKLDTSSRTAAMLLAKSDERVQLAKKQAYEETELFFEISKTEKGYDFSREEEKRQIAGLLYTLGQNSYNTANLPLELKNAAKDNSGKFDVDFAMLICAFLKDQDLPVSPLYIAEQIKHFTAKDPENSDKIIKTMLELNRSDYQLDNNDPAFENLMGACFTKEGDFIEDAPEIILELADYAGTLLDYWINADMIKESDILYYLDLTKTIILGYAENIIDEDGNINDTEIPNETEFQDTIEELFEPKE